MRKELAAGLVTAIILSGTLNSYSQELYVFSDPASNIAARSISIKQTAKFVSSGFHSGKFEHRQMPEVMVGLSKNLMVRLSTTFSDMYSDKLRWESVKAYAKYRFLSNDEVHRHFRMAAFGEASYSVNEVFYDELGLDGDHTGVQGGVILTQLWNKLAVSSTLGYLHVLTERPKFFAENYPYQAFNYSLSAGYLVLPFSYTDYRQTNLNVYVELLGQKSLDQDRYFVDVAPALQLIFNSNTKMNVGYRIQVESNMHRMSQIRWQIAIERTFLNALKK